jgi:hypothetical protein
MVGYYFHHPAAQTVQGLDLWARFTQLRCIQGVTKVVLDASRERFHIGAGIGEPNEFLHAPAPCLYWHSKHMLSKSFAYRLPTLVPSATWISDLD